MILLLVTLILFTPINLVIEYKKHLAIKIKLFGIPVVSLSNHKKKQKFRKKEKRPERNPEKKKNKKDIIVSIKKIGLIVKSIPESAREIAKKIKINTLRLILYIGAEDAAETAIKYGQASALVYPVVSAVNSLSKPKETEVSVIPNFPSDKINADFKIDIKSSIFSMMMLAIVLFKKYKEIV